MKLKPLLGKLALGVALAGFAFAPGLDGTSARLSAESSTVECSSGACQMGWPKYMCYYCGTTCGFIQNAKFVGKPGSGPADKIDYLDAF